MRATIDHIAFAVADLDQADRRWRDQLGGRWVAWTDPSEGFRSRQLRYRGGGKLELIAPVEVGDGSFIDRFLARFGNRVHHITLKVDALHDAVAELRMAGLDVVDVNDSDPMWQEAFLRPSQVGGLVVQIAVSPHSDEQWAATVGHTPQPPPPDAAVLNGVLLSHPDLDAAANLWTLLGAEVARSPQRLVCRWSGAPLQVLIERGDTSGPVALRLSDVPSSAAPILTDAGIEAADTG